MARGRDERGNPNRKVGRGHPLLQEERQMREQSNIYTHRNERETAINEQLRKRPSAENPE